MTLANKVTSARFFLSLAYFVLLALVVTSDDPRTSSLLLDIGFGLFLLVVFGDVLDGYLARKYGEVTHFGRIADPFVDKILVCGSFIFFLSIEPLRDVFHAWFVVVVLAREFLVQGIRSAAEASGIAFGATFWGKQKTFVQNVAVGTAICTASHLAEVEWALMLTKILMWLALVSTVVSGAVYVVSARGLFRGQKI